MGERISLTKDQGWVHDRLGERIEIGNELVVEATGSADADALDACRERYQSWSEYNETLLRTSFEGPVVAEYEPDLAAGTVYDPRTPPEARFRQDTSRLKTAISDRCRRLESIRDRLNLFEVAPRAQGRAQARADRPGMRPDAVFVVHGHADAPKLEVARWLESVGLEAVILHEQPNAGRTIIEKFSEEADGVGYAVVLATADDEGRLKGADELRLRARQNVVLELGFFVGKLGRDKVTVLREPGVELPSDYNGVMYMPLDSAGAWKLGLVQELKRAGLDVNEGESNNA